MSFLFLLQGVAMDVDLCGQIEKVSTFISHYQDHKAYDGDSFFDFVVEDYFNGDGTKEGHHDGPEKNNFPDHTHQQCCHPVVFVTSTNAITIKSIKFHRNTKFNYHTFHFHSRFLESLFQPPRA
ncbi:MAG TPA: hypothetical protein ENH60_02635 [Pricia sp.]|uniref:Uncharacterized protein n=2 Tax=root TaxID=1 RepID=A0A831QRT1_9FLAO|nr:hypothetical protein [Pricia sp.]HEA23739.1 hypothetical protein [Pricia antarctica]